MHFALLCKYLIIFVNKNDPNTFSVGIVSDPSDPFIYFIKTVVKQGIKWLHASRSREAIQEAIMNDIIISSAS